MQDEKTVAKGGPLRFPAGERCRRLFAAAALALGAAAAPAGRAAAAMIEDEAAFSAQLQRRLQEALDRRFGPQRCAAEVAVDLGLSKESRGWLTELMSPPKAALPAAAAQRPDWPWLRESAADGKARYVLPGAQQENDKDKAAAAPPAAGAAPSPGTVTDLIRAFGSEVLTVRVRIVLDAGLPKDAEAAATALAEQVTGASVMRGDRITVERSRLPTPLERLARDPVSWAALAGPAARLAAALALLLAALWLGLLLSRSLRRGTEAIAAAVGRAADRSLNLRIEGAQTAQAALAGPARPEAEELEAEEAAPAPAAAGEPVVIELAVEHVPRLAHLLKEQSPQNVALVMPHLKAEVRKAYLEAVPKDFAAEVMLAMAPVRYVEPGLLKQLKEELERRVHGVVGGPEQAAEMLGALAGDEQRMMLERLRQRDAQAAAAIRERIFLFEDLALLDAGELAEVAAAVGAEKLAAASCDCPEALREALAGALVGRAAQVYREAVDLARAAPGAQQARRRTAAQAEALKTVEGMIRSGRVRKPRAAAALGHIPADQAGGAPDGSAGQA